MHGRQEKPSSEELYILERQTVQTTRIYKCIEGNHQKDILHSFLTSLEDMLCIHSAGLYQSLFSFPKKKKEKRGRILQRASCISPPTGRNIGQEEFVQYMASGTHEFSMIQPSSRCRPYDVVYTYEIVQYVYVYTSN